MALVAATWVVTPARLLALPFLLDLVAVCHPCPLFPLVNVMVFEAYLALLVKVAAAYRHSFVISVSMRLHDYHLGSAASLYFVPTAVVCLRFHSAASVSL